MILGCTYFFTQLYIVEYFMEFQTVSYIDWCDVLHVSLNAEMKTKMVTRSSVDQGLYRLLSFGRLQSIWEGDGCFKSLLKLMQMPFIKETKDK